MFESVKQPGGGIHKFMVVTALQQRYKELEEMQKLEESAKNYSGKMRYAMTDVEEDNASSCGYLAESHLKSVGLVDTRDYKNFDEYLSNMFKIAGEARNRIDKLSDIAGLPPMTPEEKTSLGYAARQKVTPQILATLKAGVQDQALVEGKTLSEEETQSRVSDYYERVKDLIDFQASMNEELRRISEIMKTVPAQKEYLQKAFPDFEKSMQQVSGTPIEDTLSKIDESVVDHYKNRTANIEEWWKKQGPAPKMAEAAQEIKSFKVPETATGAKLQETAYSSSG